MRQEGKYQNLLRKFRFRLTDAELGLARAEAREKDACLPSTINAARLDRVHWTALKRTWHMAYLELRNVMESKPTQKLRKKRYERRSNTKK